MSLTNLFTNPQSKPAQRLAELGARRRELVAQEREELTRLDAARDEHTRLQRVIADSEAKALALGEDTAPAKGATTKRNKLAQEIDTRTATTDKLARAIVTLDDEARETTRVHCDELIQEAIDLHDHARERIAQLTAELHQQQAALRAAYTSAQTILAAAGLSVHTARLRVAPSVETLVREGGAPPLMHPDDRATVSAEYLRPTLGKDTDNLITAIR